ncbi:tetratricopeptide repeat protein [Novosphingobium mangrovi (ex Huang et al. 2023)]|uniref:Tetratricopeptide repeat protein n=1 Tax=Novosphingobium mangrovi (ex Huang et al. 2023) TaxID=2976432 RepID=A0ABT2I415_9SPHN|nr:tetratricopeptide repeat protein [Novosphingobium mangrovi (ex Huang et al. 2023)]MCT2399551.1 tetratricopeptide repeat protein [Novosphingobium mangrovi (ex Huang et al. 2023)]
MKYLIPIACAVLLSGCGVDPRQQYNRAKDAYAAHDYLSAKLDLVDLLEKDTGNRDARELLVRSYLALGDGEAAAAALLKLDPAQRPADYKVMLGEAALLRSRPDEALEAVGQVKGAGAERIRALAYLGKDNREAAAAAFAKGMISGQRDPRLLADYARFTLQQGDVKKARSLVDAALQADPNSLDALLVNGRTATAEGQLSLALDSYSRALDSYPGNLAAIVGKASVLGDLGRTDEMEQLLDSARSKVGGSDALTYLQARAAAARNDWKSVRNILQANETFVRDRDDASILYAQALDRLGQEEQARSRLMPVLTRSPNNAIARRLLATVQLKLGDANGALKTLEPLVGQPSALAEDLRLYAKAAKAAGRPDADRIAREALFPTPQSLAAELANADTALRARNWANAVVIYERIIAVTDGTNPLVLNNLAYAKGQLGDKADALKYALEALKYAPTNASIMDTAGWLLFETGTDRDRAVKLLREAAAKAPDNATIRQHLEKAQAAG